jgi:hypothetical protein
MAAIQVNVNEKGCTLTRKTEITSNLTDATVSIEGGDMCVVAWVDFKDALSDGWDIGERATTIDAIRALVAGK